MRENPNEGEICAIFRRFIYPLGGTLESKGMNFIITFDTPPPFEDETQQYKKHETFQILIEEIPESTVPLGQYF